MLLVNVNVCGFRVHLKNKGYKVGVTVGWDEGGEDISGVIIRIVKKECMIRADDGEEYMKKKKDIKVV